jgi:hypothetical protein
MFGNKDRDHADASAMNAALNAEVDRLSALALPQLAAEVMTKGFGPTGPGEGGETSVDGIAGELTPAYEARADGDADARVRLKELVAEGVQALEHASLIRTQYHYNADSLWYTANRLGRSALERNAVDRILGGGSL